MPIRPNTSRICWARFSHPSGDLAPLHGRLHCRSLRTVVVSAGPEPSICPPRQPAMICFWLQNIVHGDRCLTVTHRYSQLHLKMFPTSEGTPKPQYTAVTPTSMPSAKPCSAPGSRPGATLIVECTLRSMLTHFMHSHCTTSAFWRFQYVLAPYKWEGERERERKKKKKKN